MNTNPDAIKILCYGDSNTWGQKPDKSGRYAPDVRWPGKLQQLLGDNYYIVEEGLSSRTTDLEYAKKPGRNGKTYLQPCLESHNPVDVVILMLGTNDLKIAYNRSAEDIASAIIGLVDTIRQFGKDKSGNAPKIVLVSPILVNDEAQWFSNFYSEDYNHDAVEKSKKLAELIQNEAVKNNCYFVDAATVASPGDDGLHFSPESHPALAEVIAQEIKKIGQ